MYLDSTFHIKYNWTIHGYFVIDKRAKADLIPEIQSLIGNVYTANVSWESVKLRGIETYHN